MECLVGCPWPCRLAFLRWQRLFLRLVTPVAPLQKGIAELTPHLISPGQIFFALTQFGMNGAMNPAQAAAAAAVGNQTGRTVYVGNLPADASVDELLNLVHFGPLESVRVLPEKSCVFISFLDGATAAAFHADATNKKLTLHGQELKIGWGKASPVPSQVMLSITQSNASRNVYLGGLDESTTEENLRDDLGRFGLIDQVKIVRDKNIGFIHFLSISVATKVRFSFISIIGLLSQCALQVVATLPTEPQWAGKRVNYGKDRCAYIPKSQQPNGVNQHTPQIGQTQLNALSAMSAAFPPMTPFPSATFPVGIPGFDSPTSPAFAAMAVAGQQLNRTVYLGNIHPETNTEDLCNAIRGGVIQSIRYMQDKHIAVSFQWTNHYRAIVSNFYNAPVCHFRRCGCCLHFPSSGNISGSYAQQPSSQGRLGQEFGPHLACSRSLHPSWRDEKRICW